MAQEVTPRLLQQVALDNQRTNQIGDGIRDGVNREVGRDIGFIPPDEAARLPISPEAAQGVAPEVGRRALTIAEKNANERRAIAKARQDRRDSGF